MYSVQRSYSSYWSSYVNVYSGTAWVISRIKPFDAWLVSCLHLCMSICAAANSIGAAWTLSNRRDETRQLFHFTKKKQCNITFPSVQFTRSKILSLSLSFLSLSLSRSFLFSLFFSLSLPFFYSLLVFFSAVFIRGLLHRIRRDTILVRPSRFLAPASVHRQIRSCHRVISHLDIYSSILNLRTILITILRCYINRFHWR